MTQYEESDEYCPHCDNHYVSRRSFQQEHRDNVNCNALQVIEAKTPKAMLGVEGEDARIDSRCVPCVPMCFLI